MHSKTPKLNCVYISIWVLLSSVLISKCWHSLYINFNLLICTVALFQIFADEVPERGMTIQQLVESRGFHQETHFVKSHDGYILQVIRIVNSHIDSRAKLKPILLIHGFQCSGSLWLIAQSGQLHSDGRYCERDGDGESVCDGDAVVGNSLGFVLASRGYDVFLGNYRGNIYSTNHSSLSEEDDQFWQFSIDEQIEYDYPALIEYIRQLTGQASIGYIGHSQGNFMMFGLMASQPQYSAVVKPFIALSPVVYTSDFKAILGWLKPFKHQVAWMFPRKIFTNLFRTLYLAELCANPLLKYSLCNLVYYTLVGSQRPQIDFERLPVYLDNLLMGSSTNNYIHFLQMFDHGNPTSFDYENGTTPTAYEMSKVNSSDIALIYTKNDWFNMPKDVQLLKDHLTVTLLDDFEVDDETWNHMDLLWAPDVGNVVNKRVLQLLDKY